MLGAVGPSRTGGFLVEAEDVSSRIAEPRGHLGRVREAFFFLVLFATVDL